MSTSEARMHCNLALEVTSAQTVDTPKEGKVTYYLISVKWLGRLMWVVHRRYSDFRVLHQQLSRPDKNFPIPDLPVMPSKKFFGRFKSVFVNRRRKQLSQYIQAIGRMDLVYNGRFPSPSTPPSTLHTLAIVRILHTCR